MSTKMSDKEKVVRIPFTIYRDNPEHEKVYSILEKQKNRNAFIRSAILAYYAQRESSGHSISAEDIRQIVKKSNEELVEILFRKLAEQKQEECKPKEDVLDQSAEQSADGKKPIDFERLKNLF
ncbi:MAG: hypothetical protein K2J67_07290 [Lachnospiraceae bacterium]|nr:hypothetical protein [Lachnospiraceae bacterium]